MPCLSKYARIGENVRIVIPKTFERCGYPLTLAAVREQFSKEIYDKMEQVSSLLEIPLGGRSRFDKYLETALASHIIAREKWGGAERKIYENEPGEYDQKIEGKIGTVTARKSVKTGTRVRGNNYVDYMTGEQDYDPPYLEDEKVHVVYTVESEEFRYPIRILAVNCEVVR